MNTAIPARRYRLLHNSPNPIKIQTAPAFPIVDKPIIRGDNPPVTKWFCIQKINVVSNADNQNANYVYTYDADGYPTKAVAANLATLTFHYQ